MESVPPEAQSVLDGEPDAAFFSDCEGVVRAWLPRAKELLGYEESEAIGRPVDFMIPAAYHDRHWVGYRRAIACGRFVNPDGAILPVVARSGDAVPLAFRGILVGAAGSTCGIVTVLRHPG